MHYLILSYVPCVFSSVQSRIQNYKVKLVIIVRIGQIKLGKFPSVVLIQELLSKFKAKFFKNNNIQLNYKLYWWIESVPGLRWDNQEENGRGADEAQKVFIVAGGTHR